MNPNRILIVKLSSLGDLFHALPAVHCLRDQLHAEIHWVTQTEYVGLVGCFTDVSHTIAYNRRAPFRGFGALWRELRAEEYDLVVDLQGLLKSALIARMARGDVRIGPSFAREGSTFLYTHLAGARQRDRHAVDENMDIVRCLGLRPTRPVFPVQFPERLLETPGPRIGLIPFSRRPSKNWPEASFAEACRRLRPATGATFYLFGGRNDADGCAAIAAQLPTSVVNLAGATSLIETGSILKQMDLVIGNDTGPMHMAAACGVPVLALFGPTDPRRTGPYGTRHRVLQIPVSCQPCRQRACRRKDGDCLSALPVSEVVETALDMLNLPT
jgi:heptosyltransferase-1